MTARILNLKSEYFVPPSSLQHAQDTEIATVCKGIKCNWHYYPCISINLLK